MHTLMYLASFPGHSHVHGENQGTMLKLMYLYYSILLPATGYFIGSQQPSSLTRLTGSHHPHLFHQLAESASSWRQIGMHLGFRSGELDNIQNNPFLLSQAPTSWVSAMLSQWLQWAPGDGRGSNSFATMEDLKVALNQAGLGATAHDLKA